MSVSWLCRSISILSACLSDISWALAKSRASVMVWGLLSNRGLIRLDFPFSVNCSWISTSCQSVGKSHGPAASFRRVAKSSYDSSFSWASCRNWHMLNRWCFLDSKYSMSFSAAVSKSSPVSSRVSKISCIFVLHNVKIKLFSLLYPLWSFHVFSEARTHRSWIHVRNSGLYRNQPFSKK